MFRNLNTGIIKRLAVNSLKSDKKRNLFLILTIAFSACLMLTLSLKILGQNTKLNRYLKGRYQTVFTDLSAEKVEELKNRPEVERSGVKVSLGTVSYTHLMQNRLTRSARGTAERRKPSNPIQMKKQEEKKWVRL